MHRKKVLTLASALLVILAMTGQVGPGASAATPVPPAEAPHYFGPWPNWANSPFTLQDVAVSIAAPADGITAEATATIGAKGAVTGFTITNPGSGYTSASPPLVTITKADGVSLPADVATADAVVTDAGVVTSVTVDTPGVGYTKPKVTFSGGGAAGTPVTVGNALLPRAYATDYSAPQGTLGDVFVIVPSAMPANGLVQEIQYFNQFAAGASPTPSEGNLFHAFVLHPTGNPDEWEILWDSGEQTVPPTTVDPGETLTIPVPDIPVTTGDAIAFYGQGIPVDVGGGSDTLVYPAAGLPGTTITATPVFSQDRTYSFAAQVLDLSGVQPVVDATGTAFGGVDVGPLTLNSSGDGYHMPTVAFDLPDDPNGTMPTGHVECVEANCSNPNPDGTPGLVTITGVVVDTPGSGYSSAPGVAVLDGTQFDPAPRQPTDPLFVPADVTATISVDSVVVDTFGSGYASPPVVSITDTAGTPTTDALATAFVNSGSVTGLNLTNAGAGYLTDGGIQKFQDPLPLLCDPDQTRALAPACANDGVKKEIPLAVADPAWTDGSVAAPQFTDADTYEIALIQTKMQFSSDLPPTMTRVYVQILSPGLVGTLGPGFQLFNTLRDGSTVAAEINGQPVFGVTQPQWLGPTIVAVRDRATRIVFHNLLPKGSEGDLFLPTDTTLMGSGMGPLADQTPVADEGLVTDGVRNPMCTEGYMPGMPNECFTQNRATLHLHGGVTPWISDGTPHQWITPEDEITGYPEGVSVSNVPDMNVCNEADDGCQTFYYTNQQSARLMFYHDHAWGITRLNVYAGEAAGYLLTDGAEQALLGGVLADVGYGEPLVIQDRTFVPSDAQLYGMAAGDPLWSEYGQDPTWDAASWGSMGSFWYHHVYMPAQNPGDPSGMSAYGRWMFGPWFWPPADPPHGPIDNPYYDPACDLNDPSTWVDHGYQTDPFCEPKLIPGTPNISVGMEQFNDTPIVNGVAYPTHEVLPKSYRFRVLNAANDRFWNLQWYVADDNGTPNDPTDDTEVKLDPQLLAAAQNDPVVFPTPVHNASTNGPDWIQIGNEGGFLPAPVVVDGQQETTWITDPTRFDVGNVDLHSLLLSPAERADVIVDFSEFRGKTLILYNDAPAAFPARVPSYDYYTGAPDLRPVGAPSPIPGYGPNTRTIMRVTVADVPKAPAFDLAGLRAAFRHHADGSGVFESSQDPIIVGQAAYNSAYGTNFVASGWCNAPGATGAAATRCDGYARIQEGNQPTDLFGFNGLRAAIRPGVGKLQIPFEPKGIHDEMNSTAFDEFGRMQANLGLEAPNANPLLQNIILYPYVNPSTELIDATNLPVSGLPGDVKVTPIAQADDGTQIWKMTHNGVDTHPIHWHLYNVQVLNRVSWDNIVQPPDPAELGWKETLRVSPLQDTYVALRPIIPTVPFELPNSARPLNPMMPLHSTLGFSNIDQFGNPTAQITNEVTNFGWEYVYHCHILSHEEMDMMRPVSVMLPPKAPTLLTATYVGTGPQAQRGVTVTGIDNSINETQFVLQRRVNGGAWVTRGVPQLQALEQTQADKGGTFTFFDAGTLNANSSYAYRVVAQNVIGYGNGFMQNTLSSPSNVLGEPTGVVSNVTVANGASGPGNQRSLIVGWAYAPSGDQTGFTIQRATNAAFNGATTIQVNNAAATSFTNTGLARNTTYWYRIRAKNAFGWTAWTAGVSATTLP